MSVCTHTLPLYSEHNRVASAVPCLFLCAFSADRRRCFAGRRRVDRGKTRACELLGDLPELLGSSIILRPARSPGGFRQPCQLGKTIGAVVGTANRAWTGRGEECRQAA